MTTTREAALEAALLKTRRLVCEAAEVGFNYADGDWADRLYRNNGNIAAALSTPAADTRVVAVELLDRAMKTTMSGIVRAEIRAQITQPQHDALAAHGAAEVAKARDAALVEAAGTLEDQALDAEAQAKRFRGGSDPWFDRTARSRALRNSAAAILALRDKTACVTKTAETAPQPGLCDTSEPQPAPAVTVRLETLRPIWKAHGGEWHGPKVERWSIPEDQMVTFFHAALAAIKDPKT